MQHPNKRLRTLESLPLEFKLQGILRACLILAALTAIFLNMSVQGALDGDLPITVLSLGMTTLHGWLYLRRRGELKRLRIEIMSNTIFVTEDIMDGLRKHGTLLPATVGENGEIVFDQAPPQDPSHG